MPVTDPIDIQIRRPSLIPMGSPDPTAHPLVYVAWCDNEPRKGYICIRAKVVSNGPTISGVTFNIYKPGGDAVNATTARPTTGFIKSQAATYNSSSGLWYVDKFFVTFTWQDTELVTLLVDVNVTGDSTVYTKSIHFNLKWTDTRTEPQLTQCMTAPVSPTTTGFCSGILPSS